ncbi:MAG: cyclic nucleotide-binding domain-containing protein [Rhodoferax sp.]|nr:cyclic nucleotide-binding domain-containing protein [Rhodoferax sp.]
MKPLLQRLRQAVGLDPAPVTGPDLFTHAGPVAAQDSRRVLWPQRAQEVSAGPLSPAKGMKVLTTLWGADRHMGLLTPQTVGRLKNFLHFVTVPPDQELIRQDELGDFMVILLSGRVAVERTQSWGERLRLAEAVPGEMLGEMSLLDGGSRFSACITRSDCELAVLTAEQMNRMVAVDAGLVGCLMTLLARKMSLRLRVVGARLSDRV